LSHQNGACYVSVLGSTASLAKDPMLPAICKDLLEEGRLGLLEHAFADLGLGPLVCSLEFVVVGAVAVTCGWGSTIWIASFHCLVFI
jgi:hypothetical protein